MLVRSSGVDVAGYLLSSSSLGSGVVKPWARVNPRSSRNAQGYGALAGRADCGWVGGAESQNLSPPALQV